MALKFKSKKDRVRLIFTDGVERTIESNNDLNGKVVAIIGPFDNFTDKQNLQNMLITLCRGYNLMEK